MRKLTAILAFVVALFGTNGNAAPDFIDVFLLIGSSNTVGQGSSIQSPTPPTTAVRYCYTGSVSAVTDPMCSAVDNGLLKNSQTGSLWPAFAIAYGRPLGLVMTAVSASTQASACDFLTGGGNWQDTAAGSNFANAITAINGAIAAFKAAGYNPIFRGIIQNDLGVNDGARIDMGLCTVDQYLTAFNAMAANFRAATIDGLIYPHLPIYMSLVPSNSNPAFPEIPGYAAVRNAQLAIAMANRETIITYAGAVSFGPRGLLQANSVHPVQAGYNEWGYSQAGSILPLIPIFNALAGIAPSAPDCTISYILAGGSC